MDRKTQIFKKYFLIFFLLLGRTRNKIGLGPTPNKIPTILYWVGLGPVAWTELMIQPGLVTVNQVIIFLLAERAQCTICMQEENLETEMTGRELPGGGAIVAVDSGCVVVAWSVSSDGEKGPDRYYSVYLLPCLSSILPFLIVDRVPTVLWNILRNADVKDPWHH